MVVAVALIGGLIGAVLRGGQDGRLRVLEQRVGLLEQTYADWRGNSGGQTIQHDVPDRGHLRTIGDGDRAKSVAPTRTEVEVTMGLSELVRRIGELEAVVRGVPSPVEVELAQRALLARDNPDARKALAWQTLTRAAIEDVHSAVIAEGLRLGASAAEGDVRATVLKAAGRWSRAPVVLEALMNAARQDIAPEVRVAAVDALAAQMENLRVRELLLDIQRQDTSTAVAASVERALALIPR